MMGDIGTQYYPVKLTYFKDNGKFYGDGQFNTELDKMYQLFDHVRMLQRTGRLPGLIEGAGKTFTILIEPFMHPMGYPQLIHPNK